MDTTGNQTVVWVGVVVIVASMITIIILLYLQSRDDEKEQKDDGKPDKKPQKKTCTELPFVIKGKPDFKWVDDKTKWACIQAACSDDMKTMLGMPLVADVTTVETTTHDPPGCGRNRTRTQHRSLNCKTAFRHYPSEFDGCAATDPKCRYENFKPVDEEGVETSEPVEQTTYSAAAVEECVARVCQGEHLGEDKNLVIGTKRRVEQGTLTKDSDKDSCDPQWTHTLVTEITCSKDQLPANRQAECVACPQSLYEEKDTEWMDRVQSSNAKLSSCRDLMCEKKNIQAGNLYIGTRKRRVHGVKKQEAPESCPDEKTWTEEVKLNCLEAWEKMRSAFGSCNGVRCRFEPTDPLRATVNNVHVQVRRPGPERSLRSILPRNVVFTRPDLSFAFPESPCQIGTNHVLVTGADSRERAYCILSWTYDDEAHHGVMIFLPVADFMLVGLDAGEPQMRKLLYDDTAAMARAAPFVQDDNLSQSKKIDLDDEDRLIVLGWEYVDDQAKSYTPLNIMRMCNSEFEFADATDDESLRIACSSQSLQRIRDMAFLHKDMAHIYVAFIRETDV